MLSADDLRGLLILPGTPYRINKQFVSNSSLGLNLFCRKGGGMTQLFYHYLSLSYYRLPGTVWRHVTKLELFQHKTPLFIMITVTNVCIKSRDREVAFAILFSVAIDTVAGRELLECRRRPLLSGHRHCLTKHCEY